LIDKLTKENQDLNVKVEQLVAKIQSLEMTISSPQKTPTPKTHEIKEISEKQPESAPFLGSNSQEKIVISFYSHEKKEKLFYTANEVTDESLEATI
jgi:cell division septum initiation protein DivIVA